MTMMICSRTSNRRVAHTSPSLTFARIARDRSNEQEVAWIEDVFDSHSYQRVGQKLYIRYKDGSARCVIRYFAGPHEGTEQQLYPAPQS